MLNVTFRSPIIYEVYKRLPASFPFCFHPHTYIINISEDGCWGLTYVPSEMSVAPPVASMLLTEHQTILFGMQDSIMGVV